MHRMRFPGTLAEENSGIWYMNRYGKNSGNGIAIPAGKNSLKSQLLLHLTRMEGFPSRKKITCNLKKTGRSG